MHQNIGKEVSDTSRGHQNYEGYTFKVSHGSNEYLSRVNNTGIGVTESTGMY